MVNWAHHVSWPWFWGVCKEHAGVNSCPKEHWVFPLDVTLEFRLNDVCINHYAKVTLRSMKFIFSL